MYSQHEGGVGYGDGTAKEKDDLVLLDLLKFDSMVDYTDLVRTK